LRRCWSRRSPANGGPLSALYFWGDTAFAKPEIYEFLEAEGIGYTARLPADRVLQDRIGHLLKRPVGRPLSLFSWRKRFAVAQAGQKRDPGLETTRNLANVG
jgi:hypothetical protein